MKAMTTSASSWAFCFWVLSNPGAFGVFQAVHPEGRNHLPPTWHHQQFQLTARGQGQASQSQDRLPSYWLTYAQWPVLSDCPQLCVWQVMFSAWWMRCMLRATRVVMFQICHGEGHFWIPKGARPSQGRPSCRLRDAWRRSSVGKGSSDRRILRPEQQIPTVQEQGVCKVRSRLVFVAILQNNLSQLRVCGL